MENNTTMIANDAVYGGLAECYITSRDGATILCT